MAFMSAQDMMQIGGAVAGALFNAFKNPDLPEPQLVANLVWELPNEINKINLAGTAKVSAGGVFVHAQPFVACKSFPKTKPKSVEIGDLLLIRTLVEKKAVVERRALLLQAKKSDSIPATPDNKNQWHLYEQWPSFTYAINSGLLKGKKRHIKEPDMYDAAKYLLIGQCVAPSNCRHMCCVGWPCHLLYKFHSDICCHYTAQPTKPEISRYRCFAEEIVDFLAGNAGKVFIYPPQRPRLNGWHKVIRDLIDETAKAKSVLIGRAAGVSGKKERGNGTLSFMISTTQSPYYLVVDGNGTANSDTTPPKVPRDWSQGDDGRGISIIEVIVEKGESSTLS
ncbi:conserved protein of unknown function [Acidithiobacillus ferrivorans]|uniref:Uncharacterized protein n=1 Tax=Acidithiobacillus ferrivorans TaxID=160808 RepID=A0A060UZR8_9PROT|nr:hypothetical protein [Acidithiobacillus ferrivorans]CDQ12148.1 hypothetical protein AFERRI_90004 [Acidithiobacillus ferrivorans]SMH66514.1 conserved protein of unknown function [Acidithiobacillus ferrivorans]